MAEKNVSTTLKKDKDCKSCVRYRSIAEDEKVTTSLYLSNAAYAALGNPEEIEVRVSASK